MPMFEIEQYEIHAFRYRIEADSEADAIVKLLDGEADPTNNASDCVEVAEDLGLPVDKNRELAGELRDLDVPVGEHVIPTIRSVSLVDTGSLNSR